jgi:hypothetical protein
VPHLARSAPADYGEFGPSYLHGVKTCGELLGRVFKRSHVNFAAPFVVTDVRVASGNGVAVLGSKIVRPSDIQVERENGVWGVAQLLPQAMP